MAGRRAEPQFEASAHGKGPRHGFAVIGRPCVDHDSRSQLTRPRLQRLDFADELEHPPAAKTLDPQNLVEVPQHGFTGLKHQRCRVAKAQPTDPAMGTNSRLIGQANPPIDLTGNNISDPYPPVWDFNKTIHCSTYANGRARLWKYGICKRSGSAAACSQIANTELSSATADGSRRSVIAPKCRCTIPQEQSSAVAIALFAITCRALGSHTLFTRTPFLK